jgi:hypothetical protein
VLTVKVMRIGTTLLWVVMTVVQLASTASIPQNKPALQQDFGYLGVRREHVQWPTPEELVSQLHSPNDQLRLDALHLLGLTDKEAHHPASPFTVVGQKVLTPDQIQLTYAALGQDSTQQAIIAIQDSEGQMTYAAVGVQTMKGWSRIAVFDCWCKYEMYSGQDALTKFVQLRPATQATLTTPQHFELVLRASGGGSGIYTQNEIHFRIRNNQIHEVLSFISRFRTGCARATKTPCEHLEARWFYPNAAIENKRGGVLVTAEGDFNPTSAQKMEWDIRALQNRHLQPAKCESFVWEEGAFQYKPAGKEIVCPEERP